MKPVPGHAPVRLQADPGARPLAADAGKRSDAGWQREMEKAQLADWLRGGTVDGAGASAPQPLARRPAAFFAAAPDHQSGARPWPASHTVAAVAESPPARSPASALGKPAASPAPRTPSAKQTGLATETPALLVAPGRSGPPKSASGHAGTAPPMPAHNRLPADIANAPASASASASASIVFARASFSPPPPIRVHAQWKGDKLSLWLGIDVQLLHKRDFLQRLTAGLQRALHEHGLRLDRLICNGHPVSISPVPAILN